MAEILFIAPSSYPLNGPEAYVNAKLIKTLSEAGHMIDLVSLKSKRRNRHYPVENNDFYFKNVRSINVVSINTGKNLSTILNHVGCFLKTGYVYKGSDWVYPAIRKCEELIKKHNYDYIYTFDYPSEIVGLYLTKKFHVKWVATWNDPYTIEKYPAPYGNGINAKLPKNRNKLIEEIGYYTYKNVFPNVRLKDYMMKYMTRMSSDSYVISPHIVIFQTSTHMQMQNDSLRIVHSGSIGKERNPKNFFIALDRVRRKFPDQNIEVTFLGINDRGNPQYVKDLLNRLQLNDIVKFHPPIPYSESISFIRDYHICLIIEAPCEEGIFLPSKVADYLQASKSIFAISPANGVLNDLWKNDLISYFADVVSVESIEKELEKAVVDFQMNSLHFNSRSAELFSAESVRRIHEKNILFSGCDDF